MSNISINLSSQQSDIRTSISPPIKLDPKKRHEMALIRLETYNSTPNVDESNNIIKYKYQGTMHEIEIPVGAYELAEINEYIQSKLVKPKIFEFLPNENTLKCNIRLNEHGLYLYFDHERSMKQLLGFRDHVYLTSLGDHEGPYIVKILKVNQIHVNCNIIEGSYLNGSKAPILYSFFPNVSPGYKVVETPNENIYLPVSQTYIESIRVWLTNQDGEPINLRDEVLSIWLILREV